MPERVLARAHSVWRPVSSVQGSNEPPSRAARIARPRRRRSRPPCRKSGSRSGIWFPVPAPAVVFRSRAAAVRRAGADSE